MYDTVLILEGSRPVINMQYDTMTSGYFVIYTHNQDHTGSTSRSTNPFYVVDKWSKAYDKNQGCNKGLEFVIKPDFSTVVCVTDDTRSLLTQRGWYGEFETMHLDHKDQKEAYRIYKNE